MENSVLVSKSFSKIWFGVLFISPPVGSDQEQICDSHQVLQLTHLTGEIKSKTSRQFVKCPHGLMGSQEQEEEVEEGDDEGGEKEEDGGQPR